MHIRLSHREVDKGIIHNPEYHQWKYARLSQTGVLERIKITVTET
jgi:hypothetical protein